jgi:peptidyl-dipeptidase Dcp
MDAAVNPLLPEWTGPHGGLPPFDRVQAEHFAPALQAAMAEQLAEIDRIANAPAPPTFDNTIAALERSDRAFNRVFAIYNVFGSTMKTPQFQAVERDMAPRLAAFRDRIVQNEKLFARIAAVHAQPDDLAAEQRRLAWMRYTDFVRSGARLGGAARERLGAINQRLAALYTRFSQNVLADESERMLLLDRIEDLAGLPESAISGAAAAAQEHGQPGKWAILNTRSSVEPFLAHAARRELRERVWRTFVGRGDEGETDNKPVIAEILALRHERANLLGYPTHAHWRLEKSMAKTPERALALMEAVWEPAAARAREEVADMQAVADREGAGITIEPWDYRYYAEKVRRAKYDLDENEVKPYLQLERLRDGMFWVAGELLGLRFEPLRDVPVYHPDVRVWEVTRDGRHVGLFYFDPYARRGKASGAWMNAYRAQERFEGDITTIVSNNANFVKPQPGEPVLVSWHDAVTLFHEFGHALHGLSSDVAYPSLAGTSVDRDYVEFPSQLLEHWLRTPQVLDRFARHCRTGEPMPRALLAKLERAARFNQGFDTVEYLASAIVDMRMHLEPEKVRDVARFEREALEELGMPREIAMRHRLPHFNHLFSSDAYSAGYYSYLWADTLTADAFEAFMEGEGPFDRTVARRLAECVLSRGNTQDAEEAYRAFRGRDAGIEALMRKRGFAAPA